MNRNGPRVGRGQIDPESSDMVKHSMDWEQNKRNRSIQAKWHDIQLARQVVRKAGKKDGRAHHFVLL